MGVVLVHHGQANILERECITVEYMNASNSMCTGACVRA